MANSLRTCACVVRPCHKRRAIRKSGFSFELPVREASGATLEFAFGIRSVRLRSVAVRDTQRIRPCPGPQKPRELMRQISLDGKLGDVQPSCPLLHAYSCQSITDPAQLQALATGSALRVNVGLESVPSGMFELKANALSLQLNKGVTSQSANIWVTHSGEYRDPLHSGLHGLCASGYSHSDHHPCHYRSSGADGYRGKGGSLKGRTPSPNVELLPRLCIVAVTISA